MRSVQPITRDLVKDAFETFQENDLLSYASAIAFQTLFALIPLALATIALAGFLDLEEVWTQDLQMEVRGRVESDAFSVIDRMVDQILGEKRFLWLTFGIAFALWQVSGAIRATMAPLNGVYQDDEDRAFWKRFLTSLALAPAIGASILLALAAIHFGPRLAERIDLGIVGGILFFALRWGLAVALLLAAVWLLLRFAPAQTHANRWISLGAVFVVVAWIVASIGFAAYVTQIASYGDVFGSLAAAIVLLIYLYISSLAFLVGVTLDSCVRTQAGAQTTGDGRSETPGGARQSR